MLLQSRVRSNSLFTDHRIVEFSRSKSREDELQGELAIARKNYQLSLLISSFDCRKAIQYAKDLEGYLGENPVAFNVDAQVWVMGVMEKISMLQETSDKFHVWLRGQFLQPGLPEDNTVLRERTERAAAHFVKELDLLTQLLLQSPAVTDSRLHAKEYNEGIREIFGELSMKRFLLQGFEGKLDVEAWHKRKREFVVPPFTVNAYAGEARQRIESPHPVLYHRLRKMRDTICEKKDQPIYMVASSKTLEEMVSYLPQTSDELEDVSGFGKVKVEKYGEQFLEIIRQYCKENNLSTPVREKATARPRKEKKEKQEKKERKEAGDTKRATFSLYKEGKRVNEIAQQRNLAISTIEGHLAYFIEKGELNVDELVSRDKRILIEPLLKDQTETGAGAIKSRLGEAVSFGEIRWVIASAAFQKHNQSE
jgi:Holliday junction resolvase RusA-like endonuclease